MKAKRNLPWRTYQSADNVFKQIGRFDGKWFVRTMSHGFTGKMHPYEGGEELYLLALQIEREANARAKEETV